MYIVPGSCISLMQHLRLGNFGICLAVRFSFWEGNLQVSMKPFGEITVWRSFASFIWALCHMLSLWEEPAPRYDLERSLRFLFVSYLSRSRNIGLSHKLQSLDLIEWCMNRRLTQHYPFSTGRPDTCPALHVHGHEPKSLPRPPPVNERFAQ